MVNAATLAIRLVEAVGATAAGGSTLIEVDGPQDVEVVARWCAGTGNTVLAVHDTAVEVVRGRITDAASLPPDRMPGSRLWLYTNFHCNLACDYCCVSSSPRADPRTLSATVVEGVLTEAVDIGVREIYLTGGEPFLHPDLVTIVAASAAVAPTVVLTNGMLFRGRGLAMLEAMRAVPRERVALQISLDSPTPDLHDLHRGVGSWARARAGIEQARSSGFRVRVAATVDPDSPADLLALSALVADLGVAAADLVVRPLAAQGAATHGIAISRATVVPEVCLTSDGVWWHPVAATDPAMLVDRRLRPLAPTVQRIREEFAGYRRDLDLLARAFPCA
jgi:pyruvate-formate lyase-activating enzyme